MLESRYVDRLHARMLVRYGAQWMRLYEGINESMVKADWAQVLDGVSHDGIRYALERLPADWPPNAQQFRALCNSRPANDGLPALPGPPSAPTPEVAAKLSAVTQRRADEPGAGAASKLVSDMRRRKADGQRLSESQRWVMACCEAMLAGLPMPESTTAWEKRNQGVA